jgi:hypothetical protein
LPTYSLYIKIKKKKKLAQELHYQISSLDVTQRHDLDVGATGQQPTELHQQDYDSNYY